MSLRCLLGRHRPFVTSIVQRTAGFSALCNDCGFPIERSNKGRWMGAESLIAKREQAA